MSTARFKSEHQQDSTYAFYRVGEQYYLTCEVAYECNRDSLQLAFVPFSSREYVGIPADVKREPICKRFYFLLTPDVAERVLGVRPPAMPEDTPYCIPAGEWDVSAAVQVYSPVKKAHLVVRSYSENLPCLYYREPSQFELYVPHYRPWDYWVKWPFAAVLMVGVDLPCSLVGTAGRFIGETLAWPLVVPTQQYMVPIERNTNE